MSVLKEFRDFAVKGNVIDLAVGVIIGAAFGKIVDSAVKDLINPLVGVVVGRPDFTNLYVVLGDPKSPLGDKAVTYQSLVEHGATVFGYGAFLTAIVQFTLMAFAIFWLVKFINKAKSRVPVELEKPTSVAAPTPEEVLLLREIRDALKK
jgi:large conductance mechanosensitive channel